MKTSKAQIKANRKWNENNLDRIYITVKKGQKEIIKEIAEKQGMSLNAYIGKAIENQIENDTKNL
jgi:predicted HicB family RNase H-like nuclease